mmetsp:Transcript_37471/g.55929  ORF Transcript_37471/g.55929 Transcript_37471/m.55929 type:complete len:99 (+) Transcript_37471:1-297(+)
MKERLSEQLPGARRVQKRLEGKKEAPAEKRTIDTSVNYVGEEKNVRLKLELASIESPLVDNFLKIADSQEPYYCRRMRPHSHVRHSSFAWSPVLTLGS